MLKIVHGAVAQYPYSLAELFADHPNTSFPPAPDDATLAEFGAASLVAVDAPLFDPMTHAVRELTPVNTDGAWLQQWEVYPLSGEEVGAKYAEQQTKARDAAKSARASAVDAITVTTAAGNNFDGDETSQTRMARAIIALQATGTSETHWVLHDNSVILATVAELVEALSLAGAAQSAVWVIA